jgi:hypothetical protein
MQRFKYDYVASKNLVTIIPIATMILIPILSTIVLIIGKKGFAMILTSLVACGTYWYLETLPAEPSFHVTICIVGVAFFYSLYSSVIWASMTLVVPQQGTSVALGLATTLQNILMTTLPLYFGEVNKPRSITAYNNSLFSLKIISIGGLVASILVTVVDLKTGQRLNLPENDKRVLDQKSKASDNFRKITMLSSKTKSSKSRSV